jgi:hypothetical protein
MRRDISYIVALATFLIPFTYSHSALAWDALTYQQAVQGCAWGYVRACAVMQQYQAAAAGRRGSPADRWVSPAEIGQGGLRGVRPGPLTTYDFVR